MRQTLRFFSVIVAAALVIGVLHWDSPALSDDAVGNPNNPHTVALNALWSLNGKWCFELQSVENADRDPITGTRSFK